MSIPQNPPPTSARTNRPQVSLRDLTWLIVTVGLSLGWWLEYRKRKENETMGRNAGALASYLKGKGWKVDLRGQGLKLQEPPGVMWGRDGLKYADAWDSWSKDYQHLSKKEQTLMHAAFVAGCEAGLRK